MDLLYIERYSIWLDVKLMLRTLTVFFKADSTEAFEDARRAEVQASPEAERREGES